MKKLITKYLPIILLLLILLLLPFDWYRQLHANKQTFQMENANGIFVFTKMNCVILIIYVYTIIIELHSIYSHSYLFASVSCLAFMVSLIAFPAWLFYPAVLTSGDFLSRFSFGFFMAMLLTVCSLIRNIQLIIKKNN